MKEMKCKACGYVETDEKKFVGIFTYGHKFGTINDELCCLYGCPECGTVQFTTDAEYIQLRKEEYKNKHRVRH